MNRTSSIKKQTNNSLLSPVVTSKKFTKQLKDNWSLCQDINPFQTEDLFNLVCEILKRPIHQRNMKDIEKVISYIKTMTEFLQILQGEHDKHMYELIKGVASNLSYSFHKKQELVFRYGEKGEEFFIILNGAVNVFVPKHERVTMTEEEYVKYLIKLRVSNEIELLYRCINLNRNVFPIGDNFDTWLRISSIQRNDTITKMLHHSPNPKASSKGFYYVRRSSFSSELINLINDALDTIDGFYEEERKTYIESPDAYTEMFKVPSRTFNIKEESKSVVVFSYQLVNTLRTGNKFGDAALDSLSSKRTATIIAAEDCHFGLIDKNSYDKSLRIANEKAKRNFTALIFSYPIFQNVPKVNFEKNNFNLFRYRRFKRGDIIITENNSSNYIYFLKSGEYEISTHRNILELNKLIEKFNHKVIMQDERILLHETKFNDPKLNKILIEKKKIKIAIMKEKDMIGLDEYFDSHSKLADFTIMCLTSTCDGYEISRDLFNSLCSREVVVKDNYDNFVKMKRKFIYDRLLSYKHSLEEEYSNYSKSLNKLKVLGPGLRVVVTPAKRRDEVRQGNSPKLPTSIDKTSNFLKTGEEFTDKYKTMMKVLNSTLSNRKEKLRLKFEKESMLPILDKKKIHLRTIKKKTMPDKELKANSSKSNSLNLSKDHFSSVLRSKLNQSVLYDNLITSYMKTCPNEEPDNVPRQDNTNRMNTISYTESLENSLRSESCRINKVDFLVMDKFNLYFNFISKSMKFK